MGTYLNHTGKRPLRALGKAADLTLDTGATRVAPPVFPPADGKTLICVVSNGPFEAAAVCDTEREFRAFREPDGRYKVWLEMDSATVAELTK